MKNSMFGKLMIIFGLLSDLTIAEKYRLSPITFATNTYFLFAAIAFMGVGVWGVSRHYERVLKQKDLFLKHFSNTYPDEFAALTGATLVHTRPKQQSTVEKEVL